MTKVFFNSLYFLLPATSINSGIVEKDYYVTMLLKALVARQPNIVFKGGTSLSKCYKLIKRFSEDIDLNLEGGGDRGLPKANAGI